MDEVHRRTPLVTDGVERELFDIIVTRSAGADGAVIIMIDGNFPELRVAVNDTDVYASTPYRTGDGDTLEDRDAEAFEFTFRLPKYDNPTYNEEPTDG